MVNDPKQQDRIVEHSRKMIRDGSKSFAGAARLLPTTVRESVYMLYAWCRYCDDQIDAQYLGHGIPCPKGSAETLARLEAQTRAALAGEAVDEPVFIALQRVIRRHAIPERHAFELLRGFKMDVDGRRFNTLEDSLDYCYHVAGVVGVMMAHLMDAREQEALDRAADLGIALQMTNIARDVMDDAEAGRIYLPLDWLQEAAIPVDEIANREHRKRLHEVTRRYLETAELYYESARYGLSWLDPRCAWAIASARGIYREIGRQVLDRGATAWDTRTVVGPTKKVLRALSASVDAALAVGLRRQRQDQPSSRKGLWTRP